MVTEQNIVMFTSDEWIAEMSWRVSLVKSWTCMQWIIYKYILFVMAVFQQIMVYVHMHSYIIWLHEFDLPGQLQV